LAVIYRWHDWDRVAAAKLFVKEGAYVLHHGPSSKELDEPCMPIGSNVTGVQGAFPN